MAITHVDGPFNESHFSREFGFHGSAEQAPPSRHRRHEEPMPHERGAEEAPGLAHGGHHMHPDGHRVVRVEHRRDDGSVVHHHEHGGFTVHHADGHVTHHHHDGHMAHHAEGGAHHGHEAHPHGGHVVRVEHRHDGTEVHHYSHGGHTIHHADGRMTHHEADGSPAGSQTFEDPGTPGAGGDDYEIGIDPHTGGAYARGGHVMTHPHGHHVVHEESGRDGSTIHHHSHGGMTVHHADGHVTHHEADGRPAHHGGMEHRAHGGRMHERHMAGGGDFHKEHPEDAREDKALIAKGIHQAERHHGEDETPLHLARGGRPGDVRARLPRGMKPPAERRRPPIGTAEHAPPEPRGPSTPEMTRTARGRPTDSAQDYGGTLPYGVEPTDEPDGPGDEQNMPAMAHGGRHRGRR